MNNLNGQSIARLQAMQRRQQSQQLRMNDLAETASSITQVGGKIKINNAGEAYIEIEFPVYFTDIPSVSFGYEINDVKSIAKGSAPTVTAEIYEWETYERPPSSRFYTGAKMVVVSTGPPLIKFIVHWQATGIAFTNPIF